MGNREHVGSLQNYQVENLQTSRTLAVVHEKGRVPGPSSRSPDSGPNMAGNNAGGNISVEASPEASSYINGFKLYAILGAVTVASFLLMLDMTIIVTAVPEITTVFQSLEDVGWYGAAYNLSNAALQPMAGKLYTHFSTKRTFCGFFLIFELGSLICGAANSSRMFILGRTVAGMGCSGLFNGSMTIIAAVSPIHKRPALIGIMMGISQIGIVAGPLIGGSLTEYSTWRWCFYLNLPVGAVVAIILVFLHIPDHRITMESLAPKSLAINLDMPGFILFAPAAVMFLLALENGSTEWGWTSAPVIGLFVGAGVAAIGFVFWEYQAGESAMLPYTMVKRRIVWASAGMSMCTMSSVFLGSYYSPIYFQSVKGVGPFVSGLYLLPVIISQLLAAVLSGVLVGKWGYYLPWAIASTVLAAVGSGLISTWTPYTNIATVIGYQFILGIGRGAGLQMPLVAAQNSLPPAQLSIGMAFLIFVQTFGGAIFLTVGNIVFSNQLRAHLVSQAPHVNATAVIEAGGRAFREVVHEKDLSSVLEAYAHGINDVFYLIAALSVLGFFFTWGMGWKDVREKKVPEVQRENDVSEVC